MPRIAVFAQSRAFRTFAGAGLALALSTTSFAAAPTPLSKLQWRNVGPWIGGRVVAVAGVPHKTNLFYMGAVDGGVWKSTDYGIKWTNISDRSMPSTSDSIGAIAVAPSNPKILYVGTGESDIRGDVITGDGVFRSDDAGKTWHAAGLSRTHTISAIVVDPHNPNLVYASSMGHVFKSNGSRGVYKSTDGGKTWKKILYVNAATGAIDLVMSPSNPDVLYAAMWQAYRNPWSLHDGGPGSGLYKTIDGGAHWTEISRNPGFPHGLLGRIGVSVATSNPKVVYSIVQAKNGGVFRSEDGGAHWNRVNANWSLRQRAFYYMSIYTDPTDPDTVYVPEVDALWVSHDGGKSFVKLHTPHGDNHIVWINPHHPKILLEGNDGGATISTDGGKTWSSEHNQPTGQFYHVSLDDQFPFHLYGAQQDEGSFEGPSAAPGGMIPLSDWHSVAYGESTFVAPQPGNPHGTYGSGYFSILLHYNSKFGQYNSVSPWPNYQDGASSSALKYRFGWTHPIFFSPTNPKDLLVASQYVLKSEDGGRSWTRISPDLTRNDPVTEKPSGGPIDLDQSGAEVYPDISALAVSPLDGKVIWAGSADGLVHVTRDGGAHWQLVTPKGLPEWAQISSIQPSQSEPGSAFLSASRYMWDDFHPYVFETTDYGRHWAPITTGLPDHQYVLAVRQDPSDPQLLFLGTKNTVYVSFSGGKNWQPLTLNLPPVQVRDIAIDSRQGDVAIATHGRSFWVLDNLSLLEQLSHQSVPAPQAVQLFAPQEAWLTHAYGKNSRAKYRHSVGVNPPFGATVFFHIPEDYKGQTPVSLSFFDAKGSLIRRFDLHLKTKHAKLSPVVRDNQTPTEKKEDALQKLTAISPGMNRFQWNLRYPDATEVTGFQPPEAAGGLEDGVEGPTVNPGRYMVMLDFGGRKTQVFFKVALDPRLHPAPDALKNRLALELRIHETLNRLDRTINKAIQVRDKLKMAVAAGKLPEATAQPSMIALNGEINKLVQLAIQSSEGDVLHETKLRSHLAYLAADIGLSYDQPTRAQYAVFKDLDRKAVVGERELDRAMKNSKRLF
jgi:photosystem II stability/assembly factor-like uncharacterized protein